VVDVRGLMVEAGEKSGSLYGRAVDRQRLYACGFTELAGLFRNGLAQARPRRKIDPAWRARSLGTAGVDNAVRLHGRLEAFPAQVKKKQPVWRKLPPLGRNCGRRGNRTLTLSMAQVAPGALYDRSKASV
jgi:hypothetical protein